MALFDICCLRGDSAGLRCDWKVALILMQGMAGRNSRISVDSVGDQLCFAAYSLSHAFNRRYRHALRETGLTYPQYLVVVALADLGSPTTTELARTLRLDYGTLTPMLKRLERDQIVTRVRADRDERIVRVSLTEKGQAMKRRVREVMAEIMASTGKAAPALSALIADLNSVREELDTVSEAIEQGADISSSRA